MMKIKCYFCSKIFSRNKGQYNEAIRLGAKQYCTSRCQFTSQRTGEYKPCGKCGKKVWRMRKELKKSKTQTFFCSRSCSAIYNNHLRSLAVPKNFCKNPSCKREIPSWQSYCSRSCGSFSRKRTVLSLKREVLSVIRSFYKLHNRIPVKKEMYVVYGKARYVFGTWNNAISAAGYKPNPVMFARHHIASDGHRCDSLAEKIIDEWLCSKNITHERTVPYPEFGKNRMTCDFVIGGYFIEFFGLENEVKRYDKLVAKKRILSRKYKMQLIELKPDHIFPRNRLDEVLSFLLR
ncbi:MAG TPA: hypothetical protein VJJ72_00965 [Candidatus Paceibacterota bacterium]